MINFMYDFINRFINYPDPANEVSLDKFFGTSDWRTIRSATDREEESVELYKQQLRKTGRYTYVTSTRILKPLQDRAYFHLVYATRNPKGIIKFRDVEKQSVKEQDAVRKTAQREHREMKTGQAELLFGPAQQVSTTIEEERARRRVQAKEKLLRLIGERAMLYAELQPLILEIPLIATSDFNSLLLASRDEGLLAIEGMTERERTPKRDHLIRKK
jgi:hypothetical protein